MNNFDKKLQEMIRVDHAGEMGAKVIYDGQILALKLKKDYQTLKIVEHMKAQEIEHFEYFNQEIRNQKIRPTVMQPVWKIGGFALGFLTAILDKRAAMACTTAVEETIDDHYQQKIEDLEQEELKNLGQKNLQELKEKIIKFRQDEIEHRDIGYNNQALEISYFKPLSMLIKATTKFAIEVSKKI
jgi:ubiquinone biosynthesis monooxygenase Coq7